MIVNFVREFIAASSASSSCGCQKMGGNHPREFKKRSDLVIGLRDETVSVTAMRISNPDRSPFAIYGCDTAPAPTGFTEIVTDDLPVLHCGGIVPLSLWGCL
jgi:hypothetical protein